MHHTIKVVPAIIPQVQTNDSTAIVSAIVDRAGYESCELVLVSGALTDATVTTVLLIEDGADSGLSDNVAVADEFLLGTELGSAFAFGDDSEAHKIGYIGTKRYVRATLTPTSNDAGAFPIAAVWVLGGARKQPVA